MFSAIEIEEVAPVAEEGPVMVGAVESGSIQDGDVLENVALPTLVTDFDTGELSVNSPAELVIFNSNFVFATAEVWAVGTEKLLV